jgi:5-methylcytosine-specific restriction endonuclease McrA
MGDLKTFVAAHPLGRFKPYNCIKFARLGPHGTPLYSVAKSPDALGAEAALRKAFDLLGGHCFICEDFISPEEKSRFSLDHLRPKCEGGRDYLHNFVFACTECNRKKGRNDLASFNPEAAARYFRALDEHLVRCVEQLSN